MGYDGVEGMDYDFALAGGAVGVGGGGYGASNEMRGFFAALRMTPFLFGGSFGFRLGRF